MEGHKDISEMSFEEFFSEKDRSPVQQEPRVRRDAPRRSGGGQKGDVQMGFGAVIPKINYSDRSFFLYVPKYGSDANARFEVAIDCSAGVVPLGRLDSSPRGTGRLSRAATFNLTAEGISPLEQFTLIIDGQEVYRMRNRGILFFNNIGNAPEAAALAKACRAGRTVKVDMGELFWLDENGNEKRHGFIIIAGSGFDAEIMMKAAPTKNDIGEIAYFLSALATPNPTVAHFTIEHDGIVEELDGICCMAGNTSVIQNDINLFPDCRMNDGMVDIAVIEPVKTVQLLPTVITAALDPAGKVLGRPQFKIIQTKEAKITCTPSLGMQFDGEIISSNSGVFGARALPQCLDLIVDEFSPLGK